MRITTVVVRAVDDTIAGRRVLTGNGNGNGDDERDGSVDDV
jgi:hypothetical protein